MHSMAILSETSWRRHSNPWSGWSRVFVYPLIFVSIWFHNWAALAIVVLFIAVNPFLFPEPEDMSSWMSRGVLGERLWSTKFRWDLPQLLNVFNGIFFVLALYYTYTNNFWPAPYTVTLPFIFKLWFFDRMVWWYEESTCTAAAHGAPPDDPTA
jgi:hypothetical protein